MQLSDCWQIQGKPGCLALTLVQVRASLSGHDLPGDLDGLMHPLASTSSDDGMEGFGSQVRREHVREVDILVGGLRGGAGERNGTE